jgi:hypothetical protein
MHMVPTGRTSAGTAVHYGNSGFAVRHKGPKTHGKLFAMRFSSGRTTKGAR